MLSSYSFPVSLHRSSYAIQQQKDFEIQGHRGCRGLLPENTLPAFIAAVRMGVKVLEMDVVITADSQVVVSHEPWLSSKICSDKFGNAIDPSVEKEQFNIYRMNYAEVAACDCGQKGNPDFPLQRKIKATKPLLKDVIERVENYCIWNNRKPVVYSIEIKSSLEGDGIFHPAPEQYTQLVYDILKKKNMLNRSIIQSFDLRPLQLLHTLDPKVQVSLLSESRASFKQQVQALGFIPTYFSPDFNLLNSDIVKEAHEYHTKVVPWTVNHVDDMKAVWQLEVDGIITDYPDSALLFLHEARRK